jgi:hypothetical protein
MPRVTLFESVVGTLRNVVDLAILRRDGSGLFALKERLDALLEGPKIPRGTRARRQAWIDAVHAHMLAELSATLDPKVRSRLVRALHDESDGPGSDEDPWARTNPQIDQTRRDQADARLQAAMRLALALCRDYERTRRTSLLRDAVDELGAAVKEARARESPNLTPETYERDFEQLGWAMASVLPPFAMAFVSDRLRGCLESLREEFGRRCGVAPDQLPAEWAYRKPWNVPIVWRQPIAKGHWFIGSAMESYESWAEQLRDARRSEVARERARKRAERAAEARRVRERQARDEESHRIAKEAEEARRAAQAQHDRTQDSNESTMHPEMKASVDAEMERRRRDDAFREEQRLLREWYDARTGHVRQ